MSFESEGLKLFENIIDDIRECKQNTPFGIHNLTEEQRYALGVTLTGIKIMLQDEIIILSYEKHLP